MLYNSTHRAKKIWYNPKTDRIIENKTSGCICFDSAAEFDCFRILDKYSKDKKYELFCHKPLYFKNGNKTTSWKIDFTLKSNKKTLFIEYKSAFTLERGTKFKKDIKTIYQNMPNLAKNIIICSKDDLVVKIDEKNVIYSCSLNQLVYNIDETLKR